MVYYFPSKKACAPFTDIWVSPWWYGGALFFPRPLLTSSPLLGFQETTGQHTHSQVGQQATRPHSIRETNMHNPTSAIRYKNNRLSYRSKKKTARPWAEREDHGKTGKTVTCKNYTGALASQALPSLPQRKPWTITWVVRLYNVAHHSPIYTHRHRTRRWYSVVTKKPGLKTMKVNTPQYCICTAQKLALVSSREE